MTVARRSRGLYLSVRDRVTQPPRLLELTPTAPGQPYDDRGQGLRLVHAGAAGWGSMPTRDGKVVWAIVRERTSPRPVRPAKPRYVARAVDAIHACPAEPYTVARLATLAGVSTRTLQQGFRAHLGTTPMAYRYFEVKVADLGRRGRPLHAWQTRGPDARESYDANWFQNAGSYTPVRSEVIGGVAHDVYRVRVPAYSIVTLSTLARGVHGRTAKYRPGDFAPRANDTILGLPYRDSFEYDDYPTTVVGGRRMTYQQRRGGTPRYTADQDGAFEVVATKDRRHRHVLQQQMHAHNRGYTWNVWGDGRQNVPSTAAPSTVLGDHRWADYTATVDFRLDLVDRDPTLANFAGLGVRQVQARGGDQATYAARVHEDGRWELRKLDAVVASGTVARFDAGAWHTLAVTARENVITATLYGAQLASYVDTSVNPVLAGRVALVSGYYNTQYDNLAVRPVKGQAWQSEKVDDADRRVAYPDGFSFAQVGFAHFNRTHHVLTAGQSLALDFTGTGLNLFGATGSATLEVRVDGQAPRTAQVGVVGTRQTSYWLRGLRQHHHRATVRVVSGTFTLDGIDVVNGRALTPRRR